jgi:hypothetical protein
MMGRRFCKCVTVGLVCLCLGQGVKAPSANILATMFSSMAASTSSTGTATVVGSLGFPRTVDLTSGKFYDGVQQTKHAYGEHDNRQDRLNRSG